VAQFGGLDIIFNNAGVEGEQAPTGDCTLDNWHRVIGINLTGVFLGMKYAIPAMIRSGGGSIINAASVAGLVGFQNIPAYCASAAATPRGRGRRGTGGVSLDTRPSPRGRLNTGSRRGRRASAS
jgi:NADP-dependent 3-hydroxy acid dehydrogenase YdfG